MDENKLHNRKFQLKGSSRNMRWKLLQKRSTGKTTECSKHLRHYWHWKRYFIRTWCILQILLKYIKLVIPKYSFYCYYAVLIFQNYVTPSTHPQQNYPHQQYNPPSPPPHQNKIFWTPSKDFSEMFTTSPSKLELVGVYALMWKESEKMFRKCSRATFESGLLHCSFQLILCRSFSNFALSKFF